MNDPHLWWYVARATGLVAWVLMTLAAVWGVLLATRLLRRAVDSTWLTELHRFLGGAAMLLIALHLTALHLDGWARFTPRELFVPFASRYRPMPVALGIVALYLFVAVYLSSLVRHRLPRLLWKAIHVTSYLGSLLVALHAGLSGTDAGRWWYLSAAAMLVALTAAAGVLRLVMSSQPEPAPIVRASPAGAPRLPAAPQPTTRRAAGGTPDPIRVVVAAARPAAEGVRHLVLVRPDGGELPEWAPGAHVTLVLPSGDTRQYSLCGDPADRDRYEIAVLREPASRGGSEWLHTAVAPGDRLDIWPPANHFPLAAAASYLFVAGGIGITPIRAMIESLPARRDWRLLYLGRSRRSMAFLPELLAAAPDRVYAYPRDEHAERLDVAAAVAAMPGEVYCCGPSALVDTVIGARPAGAVHFERFTPRERVGVPRTALEVSCVRSGRDLVVPPDATVLEALEANAIPVVASCRRGVCGSCEVGVLGGVPEHLDSVMEDELKDELAVMYPCVSRAETPRLVLDL